MFSITSGNQNPGAAPNGSTVGRSNLRPNLRQIGGAAPATSNGRVVAQNNSSHDVNSIASTPSSSSSNMVPRPSPANSILTPGPPNGFKPGEIGEANSHTPEDDDDNHFVNTNKKGKRVVRPSDQPTQNSAAKPTAGPSLLSEAQKRLKR
ncbi:hypothetical protein PtB15_13B293 [Puccinia triticina]|nr:hypothetical protein PtB15_13B293 [Puccinia triticina]